MGVDLKVPVLIVPALHDLRSRPAGSMALTPSDLNDSDALILEACGWRVTDIVLPADDEAQPIRISRLGQAVVNRRTKLWIAVGRNRDEDGLSGFLKRDGPHREPQGRT